MPIKALQLLYNLPGLHLVPVSRHGSKHLLGHFGWGGAYSGSRVDRWAKGQRVSCRNIMTKRERERERQTKKRQEKEESNIPAQCLVLCKLWESCCRLAWERASAGLWGDQPAGLQTNTSKVAEQTQPDVWECIIHTNNTQIYGQTQRTAKRYWLSLQK